MSPKKQQGTMSAAESNEVLVGLSLLVVQPAGNLYLFEIPPHSAQNNSSEKEKDSRNLKSEIEKQLSSISKHLQNAHDAKNRSISLKVVFMIGKGESEKDVDNMLKWFLDIFKDSTKTDDSAISDLRVIKKRLNYHTGMIGLSVKVPSINTFGDTELACMETMLLLKGKTPENLEQCLATARIVQNLINNLVKPTFKQ